MRKAFRSLLATGKPVLGMFMRTPCEVLVEVIGMTGYDYIILDDEHGQMTDAQKVSLMRTADSMGLATLVRVPGIDEICIQKSFDMGASGITIPGVSTVEDAQKAVAFSRYAPLGKRGACPLPRSNYYGLALPNKEYYEKANKENFVVLCIEGPDGVANIEKIAQVEGFDALFVGPVDLSVALGIPGDLTNPLVKEGLKKVAEIARKYNKYLGVYAFSYENALQWKKGDGDFYIWGQIEPELYKIFKKYNDEIKERLR
ncbi:MAG: HpcH/HpaI aldolase family protein [bacterium]|jgi:4-hydroxy-2-oxoheptanedioate aldolase